MEVEVTCAYCCELLGLWVDLGGGSSQRYIEDCSVCCRPNEIILRANENGEFEASALRSQDH